MPYDLQPTVAYVNSIGMPVDDANLAAFAIRAEEAGLSQEQFDFVMREHVWRVKHLFDPTSYPWLSRLVLSLRFLNPLAKGFR